MSRPPFTLRVNDVSVSRGGHRVLRDINVAISPTTRLAVVGPNGVGKSTLLGVLAGRIAPDRGTVTCEPSTVEVGLLTQELVRGPATVAEHLAAVTGVAAARVAFDRATRAVADGLPGADDLYDHALAGWLRAGAADFETRVGATLDRLGLAGAAGKATASLSGGEAARVGLAALMSSRFDVTLLDEPTNNLDRAGLETLEAWVDGLDGALVVVSHDRRFLDGAVSSILEIDDHHRTAAVYAGGWTAFVHQREAARARAQAEHDRQVAERDRLRAAAQRQREWIDRGVSRARRRPADGDKHRRRAQIDQTERLAGRARATNTAADRLEVVDKPWTGWELRFVVASAPRSGAVVAAFEDLVLRRGDFELGPVNDRIDWGERVHLAGPNGSGKSTLVAGLLGDIQPSRGRARLGPSVVYGVLDQQRDELGPAQRSLEESFPDRARLDRTGARAMLAKFGLDASAIDRPLSTLSPGERTRALLALFQARGANLLILDEPSNHLDVPALEQLEEALAVYDGTLIVISHDRALVDALRITRTIELG